jgi:sterol desaturase/sphingolipid hydroxylase (fatty acid hydroxylase superfamily)
VSFLEGFELRLFLTFLYFGFSWLIEALAAADENNTFRNVLFNITHGVIYTILDLSLGTYFTVYLASLLRRLPWFGFVHLEVSDHHQFVFALSISMLNLFIYDFFYYWMHRLQHCSRWLWAEHELHHSEEHVNVTTGIRHHHLEILLKNFFIVIPMTLIFRLPTVSVVLVVVLTGAFVLFIHANAKISFGWFNRIMSNPQVHRIHHSKLPEHLDKNFAGYFPLWDVIFGTYHDPKPGEYPPTGLTSGRTVNSLWEAARMPFVTWWNMIQKSPLTAGESAIPRG